MLSIIKSMALNGLNGYLVDVETDVTGGLPDFGVVGLPDTSVREAKERIKAAIKNSKIEFPSRKILINLAPASTKKEGTSLDLPMAIGILIATSQITSNIELEKTVFIGELSLDGKINKVNGILPMCIDALKFGIKKVIIPKDNYQQSFEDFEIEIVPVSSILEVIDICFGKNQNIFTEKVKNVSIMSAKKAD